MSSETLPEDELTRWWSETGEWELRQLLFWRWDPIGVNDAFPSTVDEYDDYAEPVLRAISSGSELEGIVAVLCELETDRMGLEQGSDERHRNVAQALQDWFAQSTWSWKRHGPPRH